MTSNTTKIAISLPNELLRKVERLRKQTGESRSAVFRRAVELVFDEQQRAARVAAYVEGYRKHPETADEVEAAEAAAMELLAEEPWE